MFQMALKTRYAAAALSLTAWLLITPKSTATQARTQGGEGEGRDVQGGGKDHVSERNAKKVLKNENKIVHVSDNGEF